ncbi:MAG: lipid-binding SYLF domain-containing protein [Pseudomonadota bacterium]
MSQTPKKLSRRTAIGAAIVASSVLVTGSVANAGDRRSDAAELVAEATNTVSYFSRDTAFKTMWDLADDAKAMVIIPEKIRAGFIIGGSAGDAVMVARNDDGSWSQPTFMTVGSVSFGFQAGAEASEIVLLVMSEDGKSALLGSSVKLGGDISIAAGPIGGGAKAQTTDILAFARSRGLYGGASLEGALLKTRKKLNEAYYGGPMSPGDVIFSNDAYNPASAPLQNAVAQLASRSSKRGQPETLSYAADTAPAAATEKELQLLEGGAPLKSENEFDDDAIWQEPVGGTASPNKNQ